ncbi:MAG: TfoX/Sxy family protein [Nostocoides sp.]
MAYDEQVADDIQMILSGEPDVTEKKMFGGLAFLAGGVIAITASGRGGLMVRVDPAERGDLLKRQHVEPVVMRGREAAGFVRAREGSYASEDDLRGWVERGLSAARAAS